QALLVELLSRVRRVAGEHPGVRADVEVLAVGDGRRHIGPAAPLAPGDVRVPASVRLRRDVAGRPGPDGEDRLDRAVPAGEGYQVPADDGHRERDLGLL